MPKDANGWEIPPERKPFTMEHFGAIWKIINAIVTIIIAIWLLSGKAFGQTYAIDNPNAIRMEGNVNSDKIKDGKTMDVINLTGKAIACGKTAYISVVHESDTGWIILHSFAPTKQKQILENVEMIYPIKKPYI